MPDTAAHLVDRVLPEVPVRQWVLTLPYPLRYRCAWDARLTGEVLGAFVRALFADQRRRAWLHHGVRRGLCGAVTFLQRFGSALNLTPHFHTLVLDGVYPGPAHTPERFLPLPAPTTEDVARVLAGTARRILRTLARRGLGDEEDDSLARDDPLLAALTAASLRSRIAKGPEAGQPWHRLGDRVEPAPEDGGEVDAGTALPPRCVRHGGMSLHADVAVPGPALAAAGALLAESDPAVAGPEEPQPTARLASREDPDASRGAGGGIAPSCSELRSSPRPPRRRTPWAELLQRVFELDALRCPDCGQRMRVLAAITDPEVARRILGCLDLPARAPPLAPAPVETGEPELDAQEVPCELDFDLPSPFVWDEEG